MRKDKNYVVYTQSVKSAELFFSTLQQHCKGITFKIYDSKDSENRSPNAMALDDETTPPKLKIIILEEKWGFKSREHFINECNRTIRNHSFDSHVVIVSPKFIFFLNLHKFVGNNMDELYKFITDYNLDNKDDEECQASFDKKDFKQSLSKARELFGDQDISKLHEIDKQKPILVLPNIFSKFI